MNGEQKLVTVTGWVSPVTGREGIRVAIVSESGQNAGQDFFVLHKGAGVDLLGHISAGVEVSGLETPGDEGEDDPPRRYLMVRSYRLLDDDWDEERP